MHERSVWRFLRGSRLAPYRTLPSVFHGYHREKRLVVFDRGTIGCEHVSNNSSPVRLYRNHQLHSLDDAYLLADMDETAHADEGLRSRLTRVIEHSDRGGSEVFLRLD